MSFRPLDFCAEIKQKCKDDMSIIEKMYNLINSLASSRKEFFLSVKGISHKANRKPDIKEKILKASAFLSDIIMVNMKNKMPVMKNEKFDFRNKLFCVPKIYFNEFFAFVFHELVILSPI